MNKLFPLIFFVAAMVAAPLSLSAAYGDDKMGTEMAPKSVIHVVTVSWKSDATEEDIQKALDGVHELGKAFDGITRVWTKTIKAQGERTHAFVMEFKDEQALKDYAGSQEQKNWYEVYIPIRQRSTTFDITN